MRKLKVYGTNADGMNRVIVAATSQKAAAEASGLSLSHFRDYGSETGNSEEVAQAMSAPGTAFFRGHNSYGPWRKWVDRYSRTS